MERREYLDWLWTWKDLSVIKVVTGVRRCGKTTLLEQFQDRLRESGVAGDRIIYIRFDSVENRDLLNYEDLYYYMKSKMHADGHTYYFLDEIQMVPSFEKAVNSLYMFKKADIYITGSNAFLLSTELSTLLAGRYVEINMLPFSFAEYSEATERKADERLLLEYMDVGGMPQAVEYRKAKPGSEKDYIDAVLDSVFHRDIEERQMRRRGNARDSRLFDVTLMKTITRYLSDVIGNPVAMTRIANALKSCGENGASNVTVADYVGILENVFLFYRADAIGVQGKDILRTSQKYYIVDLGFRRCLLGRENYDVGFMLENVVYLELRRRGYRVHVGKIGSSEVDFVAFRDGVYSYFQVAYGMKDEDTFDREIGPLRRIRDNYDKTILTCDVLVTGDYGGINVVNAVDWLMDR